MQENLFKELVILSKETLETSNLDAIKLFKILHKYEDEINKLYEEIKD